jgi:hypothetical protein
MGEVDALAQERRDLVVQGHLRSPVPGQGEPGMLGQGGQRGPEC